MEAIQSIPQYGFWFLVTLTLLVFVHELGHFLVARWCKVRVEIFSIGFGPELLGWTDSKGTRWRISAIPLGGYVRMFGQDASTIEGNSAQPLTDEEKRLAFNHKNVWQRMAIVVAGPFANYLFAAIVLFVMFFSYGKIESSTIVGNVQEGSAAALAGIHPGDRITALNGKTVASFEEVRHIVQFNLDQPLTITLERDGKSLDLSVTPIIATESDLLGKPMPVGRLGITSSGPGEPALMSPPLAAKEALKTLYTTSVDMIGGLWQMISGVRSSEELGGILRIAAISGETAKIGFWSFVGFCALLSINLGLINLFPVPMLDGGYLVFYGLEAIRGRPLAPQIQEWGLRIGLIALVTLMVFANWNDLVYFNVSNFFHSLSSVK